MRTSGWNTEYLRLFVVFCVAFALGAVSGYWLVSLVVALLAYIVWFLYKLNQLHLWLSKGARPSLLPDSNGVWESVTQQIEITHRKSQKRKKRMASLLKRLKGIVAGLPYATVVLNENNEVEWANGHSKDYLNINVKKDKGRKIDSLISLPDVHEILGNDSKTEIEVSFSHGEYGLERQLAIQIIPVQSNLKLLIARDISERISIHRMRKNFIANASHELRTPLTVITGYLEIMKEDDNFPDVFKPAVLSASDQSARMQHIIEDLLTLSRLENSELNNDLNVILDIPSVLKRICTDEITMMRNDTHSITTDIDVNLKIMGSEAEIVSVCSNLIHNAVRHTQNGTNIHVVWHKKSNGEGVLSVIDNGQGIPAEHLVHLTERFYRVDKGRSRDSGGTGLGLAIVQHIIQRHGGKLEITSEVGKGSDFSIYFTADRVVP